MMPPFEPPAPTTARPSRFRHGLVQVTLWEDEPERFSSSVSTTRVDATDRTMSEHEARAAAVVFLRQLAADATHAARMIERGGPA